MQCLSGQFSLGMIHRFTFLRVGQLASTRRWRGVCVCVNCRTFLFAMTWKGSGKYICRVVVGYQHLGSKTEHCILQEVAGRRSRRDKG